MAQGQQDAPPPAGDAQHGAPAPGSWPAWRQPPSQPPSQPAWGQPVPYGYAPQPYAPAWPPPVSQAVQVKAPPDKHPKELPWQLAGWWSRAAAQVIDFLIVWIPAAILLGGLIAGAESARDGSGTETTFLVAAIVATFLAMGAHLFYAPLLMRRVGRRNGQSWGKQMIGIRVIRADGDPMSFSDAALRQIVYKSFGLLVASTLVPIFPWVLDYLWPTWDEQHRALHDMAADTRVVAA